MRQPKRTSRPVGALLQSVEKHRDDRWEMVLTHFFRFRHQVAGCRRMRAVIKLYGLMALAHFMIIVGADQHMDSTWERRNVDSGMRIRTTSGDISPDAMRSQYAAHVWLNALRLCVSACRILIQHHAHRPYYWLSYPGWNAVLRRVHECLEQGTSWHGNHTRTHITKRVLLPEAGATCSLKAHCEHRSCQL